MLRAPPPECPRTTVPSGSVRLATRRPPPKSHVGSLTASSPVGPLRHQQEERRLNIPFAPGAQSQNSGPREELPASHVARPYPSNPVRLHLTQTVGDGTVTITGTLKLRRSTGIQTCFPSGSGRKVSLRRSPRARLRGKAAENDRDVAAADRSGRDGPHPGRSDASSRFRTDRFPTLLSGSGRLFAEPSASATSIMAGVRRAPVSPPDTAVAARASWVWRDRRSGVGRRRRSWASCRARCR